MKFKINPPSQLLRRARKYLYLANDATNLLLKKEREKTKDNYEMLKKILIIVVIVFIISFLVNIYLLISFS